MGQVPTAWPHRPRGFTAYGLFHEIILSKLRMFEPTDGNGPVVIERVLGRYPVQRIGEREAA